MKFEKNVEGDVNENRVEASKLKFEKIFLLM